MSAPDDAPRSALKIPLAQGVVTHVAQIGFGDSFCESSVIAGAHEQTNTADLQDPELAHLQKSAQAPRLVADLVRPRDGVGSPADRQTWSPACLQRCHRPDLPDDEG